MQLIEPYKILESNLNKISSESLFRDENDNFVDLFQAAFDYNSRTGKAPLLSGIDPYGNTIFNSNQCSKILEEISEISKENENKEKFEKIISIIAGVESGTYLLLSGD